MQKDKSRTAEAKAQTIAKRNARKAKNFECNQPFRSEMILESIRTHKLNYGRN